MIVRNADLAREEKPNMRGGAKTVTLLHMVRGDSLPHGRLFSHLTIPPGGSIGSHPHEGETEYYYILSGKGIVNEGDTPSEVNPGDVVITGGGATHSIENTGDEPLSFIALILYDE